MPRGRRPPQPYLKMRRSRRTKITTTRGKPASFLLRASIQKKRARSLLRKYPAKGLRPKAGAVDDDGGDGAVPKAATLVVGNAGDQTLVMNVIAKNAVDAIGRGGGAEEVESFLNF